MSTINLLILEDNLRVLTFIFEHLAILDNDLSKLPEHRSISVTVYSTYDDVEQIVNAQEADKYDIILLDRDCKKGGSFHKLNIEAFGPEKVIAISMVPEYNAEAETRGVTRTVTKDYSDLDRFAREVCRNIMEMVTERYA